MWEYLGLRPRPPVIDRERRGPREIQAAIDASNVRERERDREREGERERRRGRERKEERERERERGGGTQCGRTSTGVLAMPPMLIRLGALPAPLTAVFAPALDGASGGAGVA